MQHSIPYSAVALHLARSQLACTVALHLSLVSMLHTKWVEPFILISFQLVWTTRDWRKYIFTPENDPREALLTFGRIPNHQLCYPSRLALLTCQSKGFELVTLLATATWIRGQNVSWYMQWFFCVQWLLLSWSFLCQVLRVLQVQWRQQIAIEFSPARLYFLTSLSHLYSLKVHFLTLWNHNVEAQRVVSHVFDHASIWAVASCSSHLVWISDRQTSLTWWRASG